MKPLPLNSDLPRMRKDYTHSKDWRKIKSQPRGFFFIVRLSRELSSAKREGSTIAAEAL